MQVRRVAVRVRRLEVLAVVVDHAAVGASDDDPR
jgi:hypothetical protein